MKVMVFVKATESSEAGLPPPDQMEEMNAMFEAMGKFNEALVEAGIMKDGDGLMPSSAGKCIIMDGASREVVDGPFGNPNDLVAGYWIWDVKDMDEAVAWAKRCPNTMPTRSELELRPFYEMEDFVGVSPEVVEQERRLRERTGD
jgi:hypothetical protein